MVQTVFDIKVIKPGILIRDRFGNILDARSTVTLIRNGDLNIIVDTGLSSEKDVVLRALNELDLVQEDINYVVNTHSHMDHTGNNDLFFNADFIIHQKEISGQDPSSRLIVTKDNDQLLPGIHFLETPGHTHGSISLLIDGRLAEYKGSFAITGDALPILDNYLKWVPPGINYSTEIALNSMEKIAYQAEFIIPGHDKPFRIIKKAKRIAQYLY
jgi:glyoxylase-like metal-dependent hydrolase (beta-lactamase superfamily II)